MNSEHIRVVLRNGEQFDYYGAHDFYIENTDGIISITKFTDNGNEQLVFYSSVEDFYYCTKVEDVIGINK